MSLGRGKWLHALAREGEGLRVGSRESEGSHMSQISCLL